MKNRKHKFLKWHEYWDPWFAKLGSKPNQSEQGKIKEAKNRNNRRHKPKGER